MRPYLILFHLFFVLCVPANAAEPKSPDGDLDSLQRLIQPGKDDSQWLSVSWLSATNIWAARQKAAEEGKPIFLWYMAGEPLGPC